MEGHT